MHLLQEDTFNWLKQWYPLAAVEDLNPSKPFATKLLGDLTGPVSIHYCVSTSFKEDTLLKRNLLAPCHCVATEFCRE